MKYTLKEHLLNLQSRITELSLNLNVKEDKEEAIEILSDLNKIIEGLK